MNCNTLKCGIAKSRYKLSKSFCIQHTETKNITKRTTRKTALNKFFLENEHMAPLKQHIPQQYLTVRRRDSPEHLYLVCPNVAKIIASHVRRAIESTENQIVAETNTGLGLITTELLEYGVRPIRLYETCPDFRFELKDFGEVYPGQVELFTKDIFHLQRYSYIDQQDHGNRVEQLLKNVPKRSLLDEVVMTVVGSMPKLSFLRYMIKCVCLQKDIATYGRFQIFAVMKPKHYAVLKATPQDNLCAYQYWSILFNLFFDHEVLEKIPRNVYVPWESSSSKTPVNRYPANLDPDKLYLVKVNLKRELPIAAEHLLPLFYFGRYIYGRGSNKVIPTIEKWVPGCGLNIYLPKLNHSEYFEDINIYTQFRELTPSQILAVFKEMVNYPSYSGSSFIAMMEHTLLKTETTDSATMDTKPSEKNIEGIDEKLNTK